MHRTKTRNNTDKTEPTPRDRDKRRDQTPGRFQEDDRRFWGLAVFLVSVYIDRAKDSEQEPRSTRPSCRSPIARWPGAVREQPAIGPLGALPAVVLVLRSVRAVLCLPARARLAAPDTRFQ